MEELFHQVRARDQEPQTIEGTDISYHYISIRSSEAFEAQEAL